MLHKASIKVRKFREQIVQNKKLAHVSNRLVIGVRGRIQPGMNGLQIKLSTNFTFTAENPYNSLLFSMPIDEFELGPAIATLNNNNNNGRNGSFYVAGYLIEERRRWPVITASPRGQCSK